MLFDERGDDFFSARGVVLRRMRIYGHVFEIFSALIHYGYFCACAESRIDAHDHFIEKRRLQQKRFEVFRKNLYRVRFGVIGKLAPDFVGYRGDYQPFKAVGHGFHVIGSKYGFRISYELFIGNFS